jgi:hypothetical protein
MKANGQQLSKGRKVSTCGGVWRQLAKAKRLRQVIPGPIKKLARHFFSFEEYFRESWRLENEYDKEETSDYPGEVDVRLGIIKEFTHQHRYYIGACRELGVPYKVIDISGPNWIEAVRTSGCDGFLVWPSVFITVWKQMFDERLAIICTELGKAVYPSYKEMWFYESKRRMFYWLEVRGFPHPETWVFYNRAEALKFAQTVKLPIVFKTDLGATSSGVKIFRDRSALRRFVKRCFAKGIVRKPGDPRDRQWGCALFQEYLPGAAEWRMIRIGDSYFGYEKLKVGDFHSGSHTWKYSRPPSALLDLLRDITDAGCFLSMDLDVFVTKDGKHLVNEMQTVFAMGNPYEMCVVNGKPGRMIYEQESNSWHFEPGNFCQNYLCNLRVQHFLEQLRQTENQAAGRNHKRSQK